MSDDIFRKLKVEMKVYKNLKVDVEVDMTLEQPAHTWKLVVHPADKRQALEFVERVMNHVD